MTVSNLHAWFVACDPELLAIDLVQFILRRCHFAAQLAFSPACGAVRPLALPFLPFPCWMELDFLSGTHSSEGLGKEQRLKDEPVNFSTLKKSLCRRPTGGVVCSHWLTWGALSCRWTPINPALCYSPWPCRLRHRFLPLWPGPDFPVFPVPRPTFFYGRGWHRAKPESSWQVVWPKEWCPAVAAADQCLGPDRTDEALCSCQWALPGSDGASL